MLWRFDAVRRLSDAQVRKTGEPSPEDANYVEPGVLWWAFNRDSARRRGAAKRKVSPDREAVEPYGEVNAGRSTDCAIVLIDEIDKADPDVPNGLLEPLSSGSFVVYETGEKVERLARTTHQVADDAISQLAIVITTNEERDLPPAFLRRCIVFKLEPPNADQLVKIARLHFSGPGRVFEEELCRNLAGRVTLLQKQAEEQGSRPPGVAEYLDAVRACLALKITPGDSRAWQILSDVTLAKEHSRDEQEL
jgi:MoxR-like ATPase